MEKLNKIVEYLEDYLLISQFSDVSWNGLQFEGNQKIEKIAFAVDSGIAVFEKAVATGAQMLIVHHGIYWRVEDPSINGFKRKRLDILYQNDLSLYACHLPLDSHNIIGNNIQILNLINASNIEPFAEDGLFRGYVGDFKSPVHIDSLAKILKNSLSSDPKVIMAGDGNINTVAVMTGAASRSVFQKAIDAGADLLVTGEQTDVYQFVIDAGLSVIFGGHNATETVGPKALAKHLSEQFDVETEFIDVPTGL